eukprot:jgi/Botrbrau1/15308/Bobra.0096s0011.1
MLINAKDITFFPDENGKPLKLGEGTSSEVFKGLLRGEQTVAVKIFRGKATCKAEQLGVLKEIEILGTCGHPNIVKFLGMLFSNSDVWLVLECMDGGDLYQAIHSTQRPRWSERGIQIAYDTAAALVHLHSHNIIHLDVKTPNILLTKDGSAKLGDVGLATWLSSLNTHRSLMECRGTLAYMAPEVLVSGKASYSADIYSYGVVLWELITGESPKRGCLRPCRVPKECSQEVADLLKRCCSTRSEKRPTAADLMRFMEMEMQRYGTGFGCEPSTPLSTGSPAQSPAEDRSSTCTGPPSALVLQSCSPTLQTSPSAGPTDQPKRLTREERPKNSREPLVEVLLREWEESESQIDL